MNFADLLKGHKSAEIRCAYTNQLVRRLTVQNDVVHVDAITVAIAVPLTTEITFRPWILDRGDLLFSAPNLPIGLTVAKVCGEHDRITFDDGSEEFVEFPR